MTVNYFYFVPCCQGDTELFFSGSPDSVPNGIYLYEGNCYTVIYEYKTLNEDLSPIDPGALTLMDNCEVEDCKCCNCIRVRCLLFIEAPISVDIVNCNDDNESLIIPINRAWSEKICAKSWELDETRFEIEVFGKCTIDEAPSGCSEHVLTIPIDSSAGVIRYTNCKYIEQTINYPAVFYSPLTFQFCALDSVPIFAPGASSDVVIGNCSPNQTYSCPVNTCFLLTDCEGIEDNIYATYNSIENYIDGDTILKINGYPNTCWNFREISECECAIEVTVISSWQDCEECRKCKGFKLTNCENSTYVKYTTNNLSEYIGKSVEFEDCPGCWTVECMEIAPPADQNLIVSYSFNNCKDCLSTFWKLTPCQGDKEPIFTDTNLLAYVGFIITLDNIPETCWTLEEVRDLEGQTFETVFLNTYYTDCIACIVDVLECQCSTAVNSWPEPTIFQYLSCSGEWLTTAPILPGQTTSKLCVVQWDLDNEAISNIQWYGECIEEINDNSEITWLCPTNIPKLRSVRPGYNTPACSADYFDKVSCKFSEALYKDVLADRYGIVVNCSKEEFEKWEIKKELLDLAAITNPDYDCPAVSGCYDPCGTTTGFVNCLTGACHSYSITYPPNTVDTLTYIDCTTCETTSVDHTISGLEVIYNICIKPGTPIVTIGFIQHTGECEP